MRVKPLVCCQRLFHAPKTLYGMNEIQSTLARLEEKVANISDDVKSLQSKLLNGISENLHSLDKRVSQLEAGQSSLTKWADMGFKIATTIIAGLVLYKLFGIT